MRVFRGEDPRGVVQFLRDAQVPEAAAHVDLYRAERRTCIRARARADLIVCTLVLLAVLGMQEWIRPYGVPPRIALWLLLGAVGLHFVIRSSLALLKAGDIPGDFSRLMPPDPELDPRTSWIERAMTHGLSPLMGYGIILGVVAIVVALGLWVANS